MKKKPPEETPESVAWRKKRFFFKREHDVHLYQIQFESHIWNDITEDFILDQRGNLKLKDGWEGVAKEMTRRFGIPFEAEQVARRSAILDSRRDSFTDSLFDDAMELRDEREYLGFREKASKWFQSALSASNDKVGNGLTETDGPNRD